MWLLAGLLTAGAAAGCSTKIYSEKTAISDRNDRITIAVSTIGPTHTWAEGVLSHAEDELKKVAEENDWDYICLAGNDANEQSEQVISLIAQEVDCIILLPMDGASLKTAAKSVQKAGIPLVIFDREIPDFAPAATVKGDNSGIGITTARIFNEYFPQGTKVLELMGDTSSVPFQRTDGYNDTILPSFTTEQVGYTGWQRSYTGALFQSWLKEQTAEERAAVGAVFTHDDEISLGILDVLDACRARGEDPLPNLQVIAGSSGSQEMFHRIGAEDRYYLFSLTYLPQMMREAIRTGEKIIKGEDYDEMKIIPTVEVKKSNYRDYLDDDSPF